MQRSLKPFPRKPIKKPVTLIVGIVCRDGIVIASDSQTTGEYGEKQCDKEKVFRIEFKDRSPGLIATAGSLDFSTQVVEMIERCALEIEANNPRSLADLAEQENS
jgi:20S proteasome alpha/beta subunit